MKILNKKVIADIQGTRLVKFEIEGPGRILSVGSSNPMSTESYKLPKRKAYQGRCLVIVKADSEAGSIELKASSEGLKPAQLTISSF